MSKFGKNGRLAIGCSLFLFALLPITALGASYTWTGGTGDWTVGANWSPFGVPGVGDSATIDSGSVTVNLGEDIVVDEVVLSGGTWSISGTLSIEQFMQWTLGTVNGSGELGIANTTTLALAGSTKTLSGSLVLENVGTMLWSDGRFTVLETARIDNFGLFDITHTGDRTLGQFTATSATLFNDATSIIRKREGTGITTFERVFNFDNQGLLEIQNGTLVIRSNINHTGSLQVFADAIAEFTTGGAGVSHTLAASGQIGGTGEIRLTSGVVVLDSVIAPGLPGANVIEIRVGDTAHDRVITPGSAQLDGELQVILITNNGPGGSLFEIVSADQGVFGTFSSLSADNTVLPTSREWEVLYEANRALLGGGPDALFSDRFQQ